MNIVIGVFCLFISGWNLSAYINGRLAGVDPPFNLCWSGVACLLVGAVNVAVS